MKALDLSVYAIADTARSTRNTDELVALCKAAVSGGAGLLQLRDKDSETAVMIGHARALVEAFRASPVPVLINDRVDVCLAASADGVHLGQDDMSLADARRLLGPRAIIGVTIRTLAEAEETELSSADYAAIGGVFVTASKQNETPPLGLSGLKQLAGVLHRRHPHLPLCAIAGITAENAADVVSQGVSGVAVISEIFRAKDPRQATMTLSESVRRGLKA
jgi:thiamine-phosphate pyrophosphorylase